MKCPTCGDPNTQRPSRNALRKMVTAPDGTIYRAHECLACSTIFMSAQVYMTDKLALLLDLAPMPSSSKRPGQHEPEEAPSTPGTESKGS